MSDNLKTTNKALLTIATELRSLPTRRDSVAEKLESASRLLIAAIDAGAFSAAKYPGFRARVRQHSEQPEENGWISAWNEAVWWLRGKPMIFGIGRNPCASIYASAMFTQDCELVAEAIERDAFPNPKVPPPNQTTSVSKPLLAMAILFQEPEISSTNLAKKVGVSPSTLYKKTGPWKDIRATLMARDREDIPQGYKDAAGNIEAHE